MYLFYDLEFANCYNNHGKIYSFGYVLTDRDFNIIKQEDLLINPKVKSWDWYVVKNILAYNKKDFNDKENFKAKYNQIQNLIENDAVIVIGYGMDNDVKNLTKECLRYKLKCLNYQYCDLRNILNSLTGEMPKRLDKEYEQWCGDKPENIHRSDMDAYYTMKLTEAVCKKHNIKLDKYLENQQKLMASSMDSFKSCRKEYFETLAEIRKKQAEKSVGQK